MIDTNYLSFNDFESDGVTTEWDISLAGNRPDAEDGTTPYIDAADIKAVQITLAEDDFTSDVYTPLDCAPVDGLPNRFTVTPAAPVGTITRIYRQTQNLYNLVDFQDLSSFTANTMDLAVRQLLFVGQEARDLAMLAMNTNRALCNCADSAPSSCPVFDVDSVIAAGITEAFGDVGSCTYSTYGADYVMDGCGLYVFNGIGEGNDGVYIAIETDSAITVNVLVYEGTWPALSLIDSHFNLTIDGSDSFGIANDNSMIQHEITVAIQAVDPSQAGTFRPRFQAVCS
jgi:hypothetical protein